MKPLHLALIIAFIIVLLSLVYYQRRNSLKSNRKGAVRQHEIENTKDYSKPMEITSRLVDELRQMNISIKPNSVPENLRDLLPLAEKWAIGDDVERDYFVHTVSEEEKKEFIDKVWPRMDEIETWCSTQRDKTPVPNEALLFDMMAEAAAEVYYGMKE